MLTWQQLLEQSVQLEAAPPAGPTAAVQHAGAFARSRRDTYAPERAVPQNHRGRGINYAERDRAAHGQPQTLPERTPLHERAPRPPIDTAAPYLPGKVPPTGWNGEVDASAPTTP